MSENTEAIPPKRPCARCGRELPADSALELCPQCLLLAGLATQPESALPKTVAVSPSPASARGMPQAGEQFGHYRIVRKLGEGGMGAVFEAEDLDSSRRVALKVLGHKLDSPEARARFLREGRLAASINHPNSVYVFGTEEIGGTPVIAMEMALGGTLEDRVRARGPLPATEAVDAMLQVINGLEAAQQIGVLHRDIKPSNCFVGLDGTVKIGDFGLSISTDVRPEPTLTAPGAFLGTPAFSSPEQLRGEELTVRSDLYSAGVTLYYLLTAKLPFEGANQPQLQAAVLERQPRSPQKVRPEIPAALAAVVLRCLEKDPAKRFGSYDALRNALLPYSSEGPPAATLVQRCGAGIIDGVLLGLVSFAATLVLTDYRLIGDMDQFKAMMSQQPTIVWLALGLAWFGVMLLYYGLFEGLRGATPGKAILKLRVVHVDNRNRPGIPLALLRAFIFLGLPRSYYFLLLTLGLAPIMVGMVAITDEHYKTLGWGAWAAQMEPLFELGALAVLFATARRKNGYAGLHDFASRTRVNNLKVPVPTRSALPDLERAAPAGQAVEQIGPYQVMGTLAEDSDGRWLLGYDVRLLRKVWIRQLSPGAPPFPPELRSLNRFGRLRWLTGKRSELEAWDAFEALSGQPLPALLARKQGWERVRFWLLDLAEELDAAACDGSMPSMLDLDRVWITADGRAKLLDFPAPGAHSVPAPSGSTPASPQEFLHQVAVSTLHGHAVGTGEARTITTSVPLTLRIREFVEELKKTPDLHQTILQLRSLLTCPIAATKGQRLKLAVRSASVPFLIMGLALAVFATVVFLPTTSPQPTTIPGAPPQMVKEAAALVEIHPDLPLLRHFLDMLGTRGQLPSGMRIRDEQAYLQSTDRRCDAVEIYVLDQFHSLITNGEIWNHPRVRSAISDESRRRAEELVASRPRPSADEVARATPVVKPWIAHFTPWIQGKPRVLNPPKNKLKSQALPFFFAAAALLGAMPALLAALLCRGGLVLRLSGLAVVGEDGAPASRWRMTWRTLLAWLPFLIGGPLAFLLEPVIGAICAVLVFLALTLGLLAVSVLRSERSLQDRLARTWLVHR